MIVWYDAHTSLFQTTAIYIVLALSFQVVLRSGVFSFLSVGFYGAGAYVAANLVKDGVPGIPSFLVVVAGSAVLGYLMSLPLIRLRGLYLGMVTFALDQILIVVADNGGSFTGGTIGLFGVPLLVTTLELWIVAAVCVVFVSQLERRSQGRAIESLRIDELLARSLGVQVRKERDFIFALSAALGGLAGALNTLNFSTIAPGGFGFALIVTGLTMAVVGGVSSWQGAVIGAIIVTWFPEVFRFIGGYRTIVYGVLLVLVVAYEPNGILGLLVRLARLFKRWRKGRSPEVAAVTAAQGNAIGVTGDTASPSVPAGS